MAKSKNTVVFLCDSCGYESSKWMGRCPHCGEWNTLREYTPPAETVNPRTAGVREASERVKITALDEISAEETKRIVTGMAELDRALGGGLVMGSAVLLGGDPGIGKSTLLMQVASNLTKSIKTLYITGEESAAQLKMRAQRLGASGDLLIYPQVDVDAIIAECSNIKPGLIIIDSIQTMFSPQASGVPGSVTQVRESAARLMSMAKSTGAILIIVSHVTKEGSIAGPRTLEHMVDTVLYFEGDRHDRYRLLRTVKNRFGSTNEIGVFEMVERGIVEVDDPSLLFVSERPSSGCAVTVALEGTRPMLVEVQALISKSPFNNPRRMATGVDNNRLVLLLAVLEKRANLKLYDKDVYLNIVGGLRLDERACDLAIALAVVSAYYDNPIPERTAIVGEIGLTGTLISARNMDIRLKECERRGFLHMIAPKADTNDAHPGIDEIYVRSVLQAASLLKGEH